MKHKILLHGVLSLLLLCFSTGAYPQAAEGNIGTINSINQDDGYIVINQVRMPFRSADVLITYNNETMDSVFLQNGLRVSYSRGSDGSISEIELIGPANLLEEMNNQ